MRCPVCGGNHVETEGFRSRIDRRERVWLICRQCGVRAHYDGQEGLNRNALPGTVVDLFLAS